MRNYEEIEHILYQMGDLLNSLGAKIVDTLKDQERSFAQQELEITNLETKIIKLKEKNIKLAKVLVEDED